MLASFDYTLASAISHYNRTVLSAVSWMNVRLVVGDLLQGKGFGADCVQEVAEDCTQE